jgi:methionine-rich copper-binding protein CopC
MKKIIKSPPSLRRSLALILLLALPASAWAHAFLDHADPAVGSTVAATPTVLKAWFTQNLEPAFSTLVVKNEKGDQVDKKDAHLDPKNAELFIVSLPTLPPGTYTVTWHAVSVDTHKTDGTFKFTIKPKTENPK